METLALHRSWEIAKAFGWSVEEDSTAQHRCKRRTATRDLEFMNKGTTMQKRRQGSY